MVQIPTLYIPATRYGISKRIKKKLGSLAQDPVKYLYNDIKADIDANKYYGICEGMPSIMWTAFDMTEYGRMSQTHVKNVLQREKGSKKKGKDDLIYAAYAPGMVKTVAFRLAYDAKEPELVKMINKRPGVKAALEAVNLKKVESQVMLEAKSIYSGIMKKGWSFFARLHRNEWQLHAAEIGNKFPA